MAAVINLDDDNFTQTVSSATLPVLVDFWAPWCGPCRMFAPAVEAAADTYDGKMLFAKVNVDDAPALAARYGVASIPTVGIFKGGMLTDIKVGALPRPALAELIEANI